MKKSNSQIFLHNKIYKLQIDNQTKISIELHNKLEPWGESLAIHIQIDKERKIYLFYSIKNKQNNWSSILTHKLLSIRIYYNLK
jgi:hypothetical protein